MPLIINSNGKPQYFTNTLLELNTILNEFEYLDDQRKKETSKISDDLSFDEDIIKTLNKLGEAYGKEMKKLVINSDGKPERRKSLREYLTDLYNWMKKQWYAGDKNV